MDNLKAKRDRLLGGLGVKLAGVDDLVSKYAGNVTEQSRVLGALAAKYKDIDECQKSGKAKAKTKFKARGK